MPARMNDRPPVTELTVLNAREILGQALEVLYFERAGRREVAVANVMRSLVHVEASESALE